jgi:selenide,water dikinase
VLALVRRNRNGGMDSNRGHFGSLVKAEPGVGEAMLDMLYDPQTSGGLLVFIDPAQAPAALQALRNRGVPAVEIGATVAPTGLWVELR